MAEIRTYTHVFDTTMVDKNGYVDVDGEPPRGRSNCPSNISSRDSSAHSSVSSIPYVERVEIQNNDLSWADQVDASEQIDTSQRVELSYATPKEGGLVSPPVLSKSPNTPLPSAEGASNGNISTCSPNGNSIN